MKTVGVCGFGYTGSGAAVNLLQEYDEFCYFRSGKIVEFDLPYCPDGLLDLKRALTYGQVKHLTGDNAIYRFIRDTDFKKRCLNRETNGQFGRLRDDFLSSLNILEYTGNRTSKFYGSSAKHWMFRILNTLSFRLSNDRKNDISFLPSAKQYICSCSKEEFDRKAADFLRNIFLAAGAKEREMMLLDQPFSPNFPEQSFSFFDDPYAIIVDRDPRDLYVLAKHIAGNSGNFIPTDSVEDFCRYYRSIRKNRAAADTDNVMHIMFEDLIYNYENTVLKIEKFLEISRHVKPKAYFNPDISIRNTQMMDIFPEDAEDIIYIENNLSEFLYSFPKTGEKISRENLRAFGDEDTIPR